MKKTGPDHAPQFEVNAEYQGKVIGNGNGKNLKEAEQQAAKQALELFGGK